MLRRESIFGEVPHNEEDDLAEIHREDVLSTTRGWNVKYLIGRAVGNGVERGFLSVELLSAPADSRNEATEDSLAMRLNSSRSECPRRFDFDCRPCL